MPILILINQRFENEVQVWRMIYHPNCIPLHGIATFGEDIFSACQEYAYFKLGVLIFLSQVSPWMGNGDALTYVQFHPKVDRLRLLSEVASGKYCRL